MATGIVTTARGGALNLDDLIQKAKRPIGMVEEKTTRANPNYTASVNNTPQVRGFVPTAGSAVLEEVLVEQSDTPKAKRTAKKKAGEAETLADLTSVTVKHNERTRKVAAEAVWETTEKTVEEDTVLGDILDELDKPAKKAKKS